MILSSSADFFSKLSFEKKNLYETLSESPAQDHFVHILSLVTDNPSWISGREENDCRNYFMINLRESMGPERDQTCNPWVCSQLVDNKLWYDKKTYLRPNSVRAFANQFNDSDWFLGFFWLKANLRTCNKKWYRSYTNRPPDMSA